MIENARRQVFLVALVAALALLFTLVKEPALGLDLSGGTQLIYEVDIDQAKKDGLVDANLSNDDIMRDTLAIISERVDPTGTKEPVITRRGENGFLIELPDVGETEAEIIKRQIETLGRLEMRLVAVEDYNQNGVSFDLPKEKERLEAWLKEKDADDIENRVVIAEHPDRIDRFNNLTITDGGRLQSSLRWFPRKIRPDNRQSDQWEYSYANDQRANANVVAVFTPGDYATAPKATAEDEPQPFLVELFPINMDSEYFKGEDMNAAGVRSGSDPQSGLPCVFYEVAAGKKSAYADWSSDNMNKRSAIILNGIVRSAPSFKGRIFGGGVITGSFTVREAEDLAKVIKTGSLQVKPEPVSSQTIGATLGKRSIRLGVISIGVGGLLVLLFILAYYRLAGLVAFTAIALNVFLIYGIVQFIEATITLPGIAGLVLTMGMAVDANILIYERIREEIAKGKELLQAVRAGFDRAMVTILDANITTFLAGVVLYNVGVGPVRGFAVTLMVGILTSLFTALFVTRLVFHYLMDRKLLTEFKVADWFVGFKFDFVRIGKVAFGCSIAVILIGLIYAATVRSDRMLGLDFTGGASVELRLKEGLTPLELAQRMESDPEFAAEFPDPMINTVGELTGDTATAFTVKLKITEAQRNKLDELQAEAKQRGEVFEPPYKQQLLSNAQLPLVAGAFSRVQNNPWPGQPVNLAYAEVHFQNPVEVAEVKRRIEREKGGNPEVSALGGDADQTTDIVTEFPIAKDATPTEITDTITVALQEMTDVEGNPVALSNPIPSAEIIGSRMVGQLRTAAIGAMVLSLFLIVMYIRLRFHEYKYGIGAVAALVHDVLITFCVVVAFNNLGIVNAEIDLPMIAAFLTIIGYSINDTIVIFDRVRENLSEQKRLGDSKETFSQLLNRSINQTLSRTILTSGTTLFVVMAVYLVNRGTGSGLEGFAFALTIGIFSGTYSTIFIASPLVLWLRNRETAQAESSGTLAKGDGAKVAVKTGV